MDTSGFSQIGRYGTLSLMKQHERNSIVTAFGIDTEELTFGRDPSCSVRLYYPDVNLIHCKITFQERKAFLIVLGTTGLSVDGCQVYPNTSAGGQPNTIPLSNNSEIEIHNKRFRFTYPPKEMRAALLDTPARGNRRLRLSMIHSAQVFTPRPSKNPRENLRILKSPMKNAFRSPVKASALSGSPITSSVHDENLNVEEETADAEEEAIVLVDGNHPRVVEEDKDLVILEDVEVPVAQPAMQVEPPKTPQRRRSQSLHRAVLIRSAQRAVTEHERKRREEEEEREEEMEVLGTIASDEISGEEDAQQLGEGLLSDEESDTDEEEERGNHEQRKSLWRKSFERLWPFRSSSPTDPEDGEAEHGESYESSEEEEAQENPMSEAHGHPEPLPTLAQATPIRRPLGSFMTPQVTSHPVSRRPQDDETPRGRLGGGPPVRHSMGGEARRVPLETAWRVKDLIVPLQGEASTFKPPAAGIKSRMAATPRRSYLPGQTQASPVRTHSEVTAEERKAIQDRRRSALREVDSHSYFSGGIPGMSPSKTATSPVKPGSSYTNNPFAPVSPTKGVSLPLLVKDIDRRLSTDEEDEKLDTRSLLERMKETVEGMKKRRSTIGLSSPSKPYPNVEMFNDMAETPSDDTGNEMDENAMDVDPVKLLRSPREEFAEETNKENYGGPAVDTIVEEDIDNDRPQSQVQTQETSQPEAPFSGPRTRSRSPHAFSETHDTTSRRILKLISELEDIAEAPSMQNTVKTTQTTDHEETPVATETRRMHKPPAETEDPQPTARPGRKTQTVEETVPAPKRSSRKVAVKVEKEQDERTQVPPARRGRSTKETPLGGVEKEKRTTTRSRGAKTPTAVEQVEDDDPLDSLHESEQLQAKENPVPVGPTKATAKTRKTRTTVKQEDSTNEILKSSSRSRSATASSTTETPAPTRGRPRKTPTTAPSATQVEVDKENEPRTRTRPNAANKKATTESEEGVVVKVRTARKTRTVPIKQEVEATTTDSQPKARTSRPVRSRTRTT